MNRQKTHGFTLVELLIVIVVIAILAAIAVIAYNGITLRSANASRAAQATQVNKLFELYKAQYGNYPVLTDGSAYCVGTRYPGGKCRDGGGSFSYPESEMTLTNELRKVGSTPSGGYIGSNGTVGPYVLAYTWALRLFMVVDGEDVSSCPPGFGVDWNDGGSSRLICFKDYNY